ncbi:hypothetical protein GDO86_012663 [Hymenochirus boettgeri]|uniref:Uncharacterized protein n=1 Tax=Hymenochirus boettgeri TaxID=247094 RepID=A0A8T2IW17_9PIPI|nr:hypothetical protein GDO86_012663 [Hymenochirus boettgeri]
MRQKALGSEKFPYRPVHLQRDSALLQNQSPTVEMNVHVSQTQNDSSNHLVRLTRMVNSLQIPKETETQHDILQAYHPQDSVVGNYIINNFQAVQSKEWPTSNGVTGKEQVPIQSWQDIVNKVNARMTYEDNNAVAKQEINNGNLQADKWSKDPIHPPFNYRRDGNKEELEMDAGMIDREVNLQPEKQHVVQDALVPDDPAKDPNNQGEDEFEEAEIARPEFEAKANTPKQLIPPIAVKKTEEEHGGDLDNAEDLDEYHKRADIKEKDINNKRDDYY